ncbi:HrpE/YscL family type III secretion apparatus protein [Photobacterium alginatilyticum]|uniref:HrpE/YscL family type III secretion apparatus protein n=1 Tax=Photobacterium alginatilyticum TaxID=1775171 RepID=A0ABW9YF08_9GAMM|nr:HrpE/YscL family type III secretion apparatus protein [Photobacterium alginatilyticum]NBI51828.1 hypothetical protein [Photobacterium alginatilyticum]
MVRVVKTIPALMSAGAGNKIITASELEQHQQAEEILASAHTQAEAMIAEAKLKAEEMLELAKKEAEARQAIVVLDIEQQLRERWKETFSALESELAGIVKEALMTMISQYPEADQVRSLVKLALREVQDSQNVIVRVPTEHLSVMTHDFPDIQCEGADHLHNACEVEIGDQLFVASMGHVIEQLETRLSTASQ